MKVKCSALLFSVFVHLILALLFYLLQFQQREPQRSKWTDAIILTGPDVTHTPAAAGGQSATVPPVRISEETSRIERPPSLPSITVSKDTPEYTLTDVLRGDTDSLRLQAIRRLSLYRAPLPVTLLMPSDSALLASRLALYGAPLDAYRAPLGESSIDALLYRENMGYAPLFDVGGLASVAFAAAPNNAEPQRKYPPRIFSEPTKTELRILDMLWTRSFRDQLDLYRSLGNEVLLTAADFDRVLEVMTEKGFISRKKVSPEELFQVITPLGSRSIEMKKINRKNPVYRYSHTISKEEVILYLDALLYELRTKLADRRIISEADSVQLRRLEEKITMLLGSR